MGEMLPPAPAEAVRVYELMVNAALIVCAAVTLEKVYEAIAP